MERKTILQKACQETQLNKFIPRAFKDGLEREKQIDEKLKKSLYITDSLSSRKMEPTHLD